MAIESINRMARSRSLSSFAERGSRSSTSDSMRRARPRSSSLLPAAVASMRLTRSSPGSLLLAFGRLSQAGERVLAVLRALLSDPLVQAQ